MPSLTLEIKKGQPLEQKILRELNTRVKMAEKAVVNQHTKWQQAEEKVLAYVKESDLDAKRRARRDDGTPAYTTMQIPYTYALLMSSHTYWTSVFFARTPVHQYTGRHGETEQQTQALEALIDYQVTTGEMTGPYYIWLYDTGKYGLGILGSYWDKEMIYFSDISSAPGPDGQPVKTQTTRVLEGYEGNRLYNVSPFDFYPDPRVTIGNFQKGEFCFVRRRISWNDLVKRQKQGFYTNLDALAQVQGTRDTSQETYSALERPNTSSATADYNSPQHPAIVDAYEFYIELIPSEWKLSNSDYPEKWVITITKDLRTVIGCQPLGLIHNKFPFDVLEMEVEAYGQYNRGIPEIISPLQNTMDWLVNTHFYNTRAVLNNLFLVDPTKVVMKDFENSEPGGLIRLKPEAYGQDINSFFKQLPIQDITQGNFGDLQMIQAMGERVLGVNDQIMGALSGGRKTATEIRTSTGFGVNRLKTITEYFSATGFSPHSQKLVQNSQQFYTGEKKFRIVGSLASDAPSFLTVNQEQLGGFYDFVPVDGTLPIDRMAQANLWKEILMNVGRVPQIAQAYDLSRIFGWMAQIAGLKNINQFKIEVLPPGMGPSPGMLPVPMGNGTSPSMPPMAPQSSPQFSGMPANGGNTFVPPTESN